MSGALEQLPRLLALVPWLLAHPDRPVSEVAQVFGVTERQLRADLDLLWVCGLPGHGPGDLIDVVYADDRVTLANADTIARPLRLTADEALALVVALRALADVPGLEHRDAVQRALAKIETAAGNAAEGAANVSVAVDAAPQTLATVTGALEARQRLHLTYYVPGRDETTEREVDPMRLVLAGGQAYLEGWCRRVEAVRLFRLDRVLDVRVLDAAAQVPTQARPRDLDEGLFRPAADDRLVTFEVGPSGRWVADYYPCESVTEMSGGGLRVALRTPDLRWARRLALRLGPAGRVTGPPDVVEQVRADVQATCAAYSAD